MIPQKSGEQEKETRGREDVTARKEPCKGKQAREPTGKAANEKTTIKGNSSGGKSQHTAKLAQTSKVAEKSKQRFTNSESSNAMANKLIFVHRDYSEGTAVKFQTRFPTEMEGKIERDVFEHTINQLNTYFAEAEAATCATYSEGCLACLTAYLIYICRETHYEKCLRKVSKFVCEQNERIYQPKGFVMTDPCLRGLRVIEIKTIDKQPNA